MGQTHTVAFVFAHPDDETFGSAAMIRTLTDNGHHAVLLLATKGDAGKTGRLGPMTKEELASRRVKEMEKAAGILGLAEVHHLGWPDGRLDEFDRDELTRQIEQFLNRHNAEVVVTFPLDGMNGHRDHVAISHAVTAAVYSGKCPSIRKLYYYVSDTLRNEGRRPTIRIDTEALWPMKAEALRAHESQVFSVERFFGDLSGFPEERRYESFVLAWQDGKEWPLKVESSLIDDL